MNTIFEKENKSKTNSTIKNTNCPNIRLEISSRMAVEDVRSEMRKAEMISVQAPKNNILYHLKHFNKFEDVKSFFNEMKVKLSPDIISKTEKYAIVSDKEWVNDITSIGEILEPGVNFQAFPESKMDLAERWLNIPSEKNLSIKTVDTGSEKSIGICINGKLTKEDYESMNYHFDKFLKDHNDLRLYVEVKNLEGLTFKAAWEDIKSGVKYIKDISKVAFVGDDDWKAAVKLGDFVTPGTDAKYFPYEEKNKALVWLN